MVKVSIFDKTNDLLIVDVLQSLSKKKQWITSAKCPVGPDNPEICALLSVEHRRTHMLVGSLQIEDKIELSESDQFSS